MDRHKILDFPLNPTLTIVRQIFRRVIQCESKGVQSAIQRCQGYTVLYLQTCKDLCIVEGTGAGDGQPAPQSKPRELRQRARATCFVPVMAINKTDFLAGISFFYVPARFGADFLAAIEINRDLAGSHIPRTEGRRTIHPLTGICSLTLAHHPGRREGAQSPSLRDLLAYARTSPSRLRRGWAISNKKAPSSKLVVLFCCLLR